MTLYRLNEPDAYTVFIRSSRTT